MLAYLKEKVDSVLGHVTAHENDVRVERQQLLHKNLDVATRQHKDEHPLLLLRQKRAQRRVLVVVLVVLDGTGDQQNSRRDDASLHLLQNQPSFRNPTLCAKFFRIMYPSTNRLCSGSPLSTVITFITELSELIDVPQHCPTCGAAGAKTGTPSVLGDDRSSAVAKGETRSQQRGGGRRKGLKDRA